MQNKTNERGEDSNRDSDRNEQMERQVEDGGKKSEKTDGGRDHRRRANGDEEDGHERPIEESSNPQNVARLPGRQDDDQAEEGEPIRPRKRRHLMTEEEKREERRAANRRSALESRQRRKFLIEDLQRQVDRLTRETTELRAVNETLKKQLDSSRTENNHLRMVLSHTQASNLMAPQRSLAPGIGGVLGAASVQGAVLGRSQGLGGLGAHLLGGTTPQALLGGLASRNALAIPAEVREAELRGLVADVPPPVHQILLQQHQSAVLGPTGRLSAPLESASAASEALRRSSARAAELALLTSRLREREGSAPERDYDREGEK